MISHLRAIGWIQAFRCVLGISLGAFLLFRGLYIPSERRSRLEPGDDLVFVAAGAACLLLATLRGIQGAGIVRSLRRRRHQELPTFARRDGRWRAVLAALAWLILLGAIGSLWALPRTGSDLPPAVITLVRARFPLFLALAAVTAAALGHLVLRLDGRRLRRFGIAMAWIDLANLVIFPFTTAAGTYGLLVFRHPDTVDWFEGKYSGNKLTVDS